MSKKIILDAIKSHYGFKSNTEYAAFLGIAPQTLSSWYSRNSIDYDLIYSKCVDIDANWLLTGEGEMLKSSPKEYLGSENDSIVSEPKETYHNEYKEKYIEKLESENERLQAQVDNLEKDIENKQEIINAFINGDIVRSPHSYDSKKSNGR